MNGVTKEAIKRLLATVCMMWLWETRDEKDAIWMTYWIYPKDVDIKDDRMKGKRIQIDFNIEDEKSPSF